MFIILHGFVGNLSVIAFLKEQRVVFLRFFFKWLDFLLLLFFKAKAKNINCENKYDFIHTFFLTRLSNIFWKNKAILDYPLCIRDLEKNKCWRSSFFLFMGSCSSIFLFFMAQIFWHYPGVGITFKSCLYGSEFPVLALLTFWGG